MTKPSWHWTLQPDAEKIRVKMSEKLKGRKVWNKGKKGAQIGPNKGKKFSDEVKERLRSAHLGQKAWNRGPFYRQNDRQKHSDGIFSKAFLKAAHNWIRSRLGRPQRCSRCGTTKKRMYHWSNKSGRYLHDIRDWQRLCVPCHKRYDLARLTRLRDNEKNKH